jgi:predicted O-methyltransferase YrrM
VTKDQWTEIDRYTSDLLIPADPIQAATLEANAAAGLPSIDVTPNQGKLLELLARMQGASTILELGTLGGYSTIWLGRARPAAPEGRLVTLEADPRHAEIARGNIAAAGLADVVQLRVGRAIQTLPQLAAERAGPFDLVFIDADKPSTADYFAWAMRLTRRGSLIVVDNVVRKGKVIEADSDDANVQGIRRFNEALAREARVSATAIQTVGSKGYDGFAMAVVTSDA